ncbi:MAG: hypothetical protein MJ201_00605 [Mycoplasmoidaceae bacterium]|nr:hypothetical protein [Mycoplasmoidaceae bacterium]
MLINIPLQISEAKTFHHPLENPNSRSYVKQITHDKGKKMAHPSEMPLVSFVFIHLMNCGQLIDSKKMAATILSMKTIRANCLYSSSDICCGKPIKYKTRITAIQANNAIAAIIIKG